MRKLFYVAFCFAGMTGFYCAVRAIVDWNSDFGGGMFAGVMFIAALFYFLERVGVIKIVEPEKGIWIPNDPSQPTFGARREN